MLQRTRRHLRSVLGPEAAADLTSAVAAGGSSPVTFYETAANGDPIDMTWPGPSAATPPVYQKLGTLELSPPRYLVALGAFAPLIEFLSPSQYPDGVATVANQGEIVQAGICLVPGGMAPADAENSGHMPVCWVSLSQGVQGVGDPSFNSITAIPQLPGQMPVLPGAVASESDPLVAPTPQPNATVDVYFMVYGSGDGMEGTARLPLGVEVYVV